MKQNLYKTTQPLKSWLKKSFLKIRYVGPFTKKNIILCRSACLGHEIFDMKNKNTGVKNLLICQQKTRLDSLTESLLGEKKIPRVNSEMVKKYLVRDDVYPLIKQQEELPWLNIDKFDYLLMDSFSELTDQKFTHKTEGWSFFCYYTDVNHSTEFDNIFKCDGLLDIKYISGVYNRFFDWFENKCPGKKVVFFHYPAKLDNRLVFKDRATEILRVMKDLEKDRKYISNIYVDDSKVNWKEGDNLPYHYSMGTNTEFLKKWIESEKKCLHS